MDEKRKNEKETPDKTNVSKVYYEGEWKKEDGVTWAFFDSNEKGEKKITPKKEVLKVHKESEEELEDNLEEASLSQEVVSITKLGLSTSDPRYKNIIQDKPEKIEEQEEKLPDKKETDKKTKKSRKKRTEIDSSQSLADIMTISHKKHIHKLQIKDNLKKIRSVIYELNACGFSFFSLMFDKDTSITEANFKKMGKILKYDPALSLKILQIANSAYYGLSKKIFSIMKALNVLGINRAREIVYKASGSRLFKTIKKKELFKQLWYHSLATGVFCKIFARELDLPQDEFFMLGMMHDLGKVILYVSLIEKYEEVVQIVRKNPVLLKDAEKEHLGFDHCEIGRMALEVWELPEEMINSVQYHHNLEHVQNPLYLKQLAVIQASDVLSNLSKIGNVGAKRNQLFDKKTRAILGKIESKKLIDEARREIKSIETLLMSEE